MSGIDSQVLSGTQHYAEPCGAERAGRGPVIGYLEEQKSQRYQEGGSQADGYGHLPPGSQRRRRRLGCCAARLPQPIQLQFDIVRGLKALVRILGQAGANDEIHGGCELPSDARRPAAISYRTAPSAKMSLLASASLPSICSGDMYWM